MYKLVIFDMDGTLADTSLGILNSHRYAHKAMGQPAPGEEVLRSVIGGPLLQTYKDGFGFSEEAARKALEAYRQYYREQGLLEAQLYPGMENVLKTMHANGVKIALATLKAEGFAKEMLSNMGVLQYFSAVYGMDDQDTRTKAQLIEMCMKETGVSRKDCLMIGDSIHDLNGASSCNVPFLGVTYGFGFRSTEKYEAPMADCVNSVVSYVMNSKE